MKPIEYSTIEKEMMNFDFDELTSHKDDAVAKIAGAKNVDDVKQQICKVWKKIGKFIKLLQPVPVVGKFVKVLAELLDSICGEADPKPEKE